MKKVLKSASALVIGTTAVLPTTAITTFANDNNNVVSVKENKETDLINKIEDSKKEESTKLQEMNVAKEASDKASKEAQKATDEYNEIVKEVLAIRDKADKLINSLLDANSKDKEVLEEKIEEITVSKKNLEKKLDEKRVELEKLKEEIKKTDAELLKAKEDAKTVSPEEIANATKKYDDAKKAYDEAHNNFVTLEEQMVFVNEHVLEKQNYYNVAKETYENSKVQTEVAKQAVEPSKVVLDEKKALLDVALNNPNKAQAEADRQAASDVLFQAQMERYEANEALKSAQSLLQTAQTELNQAQNVLDKLLSEPGNTETTPEVVTAKQRVAELTLVRDEKQSDVEKANKLLTAKKENVDIVYADFSAKKAILDEILKAEEDAQLAYDTALATYNRNVENYEINKANEAAYLQELGWREEDMNNANKYYEETKGYYDRAKQEADTKLDALNIATQEKEFAERFIKKIEKLESLLAQLNKTQLDTETAISDAEKSIEEMAVALENAKNDLLYNKEDYELIKAKEQEWLEIRNNNFNVKSFSLTSLFRELDLLTSKYQSLKVEEVKAKETMDKYQAIATEKNEVYQKAKKVYESAKTETVKLETELKVYLDSLKGDHVIIQGVDGNKENTNNNNSNGDKVPSGDTTNLMVYVAGTILTGALALAFLKQSKKVNE